MPLIYSFFLLNNRFPALPVLRKPMTLRVFSSTLDKKELYVGTQKNTCLCVNLQITKVRFQETVWTFTACVSFLLFCPVSFFKVLVMSHQIGFRLTKRLQSRVQTALSHDSFFTIIDLPVLSLLFFFLPYLQTLFCRRALVLTWICPWNVLPLELYS